MELMGAVADKELEQDGRREGWKKTWSEETEWWFRYRGDMIRMGSVEAAAEANKELKKSKRRDKRRDILNTVAGELDVRDRWLGVRRMRSKYAPNPYCRRDAEGKHVPKEMQAEACAKYLETVVWAGPDNDVPEQDIWPEEEYPNLYESPPDLGYEPLSLEEVHQAVFNMKRRKAPGPDGITAE
eukprot:2739639-Alexandrium_andersonii.AAC.1